MFDGLEHPCCEDIKAIVAPEIGPKCFGTFEKHAPDPWTPSADYQEKLPKKSQ